MRKPVFCICKNKGADQLRSNCEADQHFVFTTRIVQLLFFLNPKFLASRHFLFLYSSVLVEPVRKPHCWFSEDADKIRKQYVITIMLKQSSNCREGP